MFAYSQQRAGKSVVIAAGAAVNTYQITSSARSAQEQAASMAKRIGQPAGVQNQNTRFTAIHLMDISPSKNTGAVKVKKRTYHVHGTTVTQHILLYRNMKFRAEKTDRLFL